MNVLPVRDECDIALTRRTIRTLSDKIGFNSDSIAEIDLIVTELATNLAVHQTTDGQLIATEILQCGHRGIEIVSCDRGPGIPDLEQAKSDHYSTGKTMGCGLGAVHRLMDEFEILSRVVPPQYSSARSVMPAAGTIVMTRKWVSPPKSRSRFMFRANSQIFPGESVNGDAWFVDINENEALVAVADGLGHGEYAHQASQKAIQYIQNNTHRPWSLLLEDIHDLLRSTRGAVLTLARITLHDRKLAHISVGNVEARLFPKGQMALITRGGVLGVRKLLKPKINEVTWPKGGTLVIFTDGVSRRWDFNEAPSLLKYDIATLSHMLMRDHARSQRDDVTVVILRELQ